MKRKDIKEVAEDLLFKLSNHYKNEVIDVVDWQKKIDKAAKINVRAALFAKLDDLLMGYMPNPPERIQKKIDCLKQAMEIMDE